MMEHADRTEKFLLSFHFPPPLLGVCKTYISFGYYMHILLSRIRLPPSSLALVVDRAYAILHPACNFNSPASLPSPPPIAPHPDIVPLSVMRSKPRSPSPVSSFHFYRSETETAWRLVAEGTSVYVAHREIQQLSLSLSLSLRRSQLMPRDRNLTLCICAPADLQPPSSPKEITNEYVMRIPLAADRRGSRDPGSGGSLCVVFPRDTRTRPEISRISNV